MNDVSAEASDMGRAAAADWPLRPWLLAGLLGAAGLVIWLVTGGREDVPWQMAAAAFVFFGSIAAAFTLDPARHKQPALFSLVIGLVMAGLAWRAVRYSDSLPDEHFGFTAGVLASALALPLFQAGFLSRRLATPYPEVHTHAWTDAISAAGSLAFTGLSWLVLIILSELFQLLKIDLLRELMEEGWFGWTFSGLAFGAALGTLRNQLKVLGTLQSVVMLVLSLLALPLALGLTLFLLATAISGPQVLWEATRSATPVLLMCAAGAFVLSTAVVRHGDEAMSGSRVMRLAAWVLAAVILPLAVFAAVSLGLRLGQHGLAPERLWGLVAIVVACAWGVAYWVALARGGRSGWAQRLREANFHLALGVCALALLLAMPVLDFGAISTRNQVARLQSGEVPPDEFDFTALRWDFGEPGRAALRRMVRQGGEVGELARTALAQTQRVYSSFGTRARPRADIDLKVQPEDPELRRRVLDYLQGMPWQCRERCVAIDLGPADGSGRRVALVESGSYQVLTLGPGQPAILAPEVVPAARPLREDSTVEVREVTRRYITVDGEPIGQPLGEPEAPGSRPAPPVPLEGAPPRR
jgi:hypothetical protein